ncbi:MAG: hypothetical protein KF787_09220 [Phycisphaeraceae bacterium]|nr:hypothetical protein [Phycisphaerae bacterium]MBX3392814.1 hypothetical protein [Phycisphaeraceae bacterium]
MRLFANLLITASLIVGVIGCATAYVPRLSLGDEALIGLTLNSPAGASAESADDGRLVPLALKDTVLTAEVLASLRDAGVTRVRVKEFAFARWSEWWLFAIGSAGLAIGAGMVRRAGRAALADSAGAMNPTSSGPDALLDDARTRVAALRDRLAQLPPGESRLRAVIDTLGQVQRTSLADFVAARPVLLARLGMGGFARLMDSFSAAERQVNRAWSAAADGVEHEAMTCVARAADLLDRAGERLGSESRAAG